MLDTFLCYLLEKILVSFPALVFLATTPLFTQGENGAMTS